MFENVYIPVQQAVGMKYLFAKRIKNCINKSIHLISSINIPVYIPASIYICLFYS